jgi:predicted ATPase/DNA-binding SARP family transcriptional activator
VHAVGVGAADGADDGDADASVAVQVDVLGPLRLVVDGHPITIPGHKRRAVLAMLALAEGRAVSAEDLLDALWAREPPESGRAALYSHVSRLRGHLGPGSARLRTLNGGYRLVLGSDELDAGRARSLLAQARERTGSDAAAACALLRKARALWRGAALGEFADVAPLAASAIAVEQLHREVTDLLVATAVEAGRGETVAGLSAEALAADPLRESAVLGRMRVLAAIGQAAEALRTGREYRRRLAEETGLDPSPALGELERGIAGGTVGPRVPATRPPGRPSRVPARPATALVGRDAALAGLHRLVATERLVTVVGPGGVGKTRVALELARRADSATVLFLAPVTDPAAVAPTLAKALDLRVARGDVLAACVALLATEPTLLVIDNCEHLLDAVRDTVSAILDGCAEITVLATSREPLGLPDECASRLAPLALPSSHHDTSTDALRRVSSVAMFLDRAARVRPGFASAPGELRIVADLVRRLDGMPLAIELAAGRLSTFSLIELSERLDRSLDLLGGGRRALDARHRTLRATLEWSYRLLTVDEQRLFRHLSVFPDGVDLPTAEHVATNLGLTADPGSALAHLVDASMLDATFDVASHGATDRVLGGATRYRMLETLRRFGMDRLAAAGESDAATTRLVRWAVELTGWVEAAICTDHEPRADAVLRRELPNLSATWRHCRQRGNLDEAAAIVTALHEACSWRGLVESRAWAEELAADPALTGHPHAAGVLGCAANVAYHRGEHTRAAQLARAGLAQATDDNDASFCLSSLALADLARGALSEAIEHALAAAALQPRPSAGTGIAALAATYTGDLDQARTLNQQMITIAASPTLRGFAAYVTGEIDNAAGLHDRADEHYAQAIECARSSAATFLHGIASAGRLTLLTSTGRTRDALIGYREVIDYFAHTGNWTHQWTTLRNLARLLRQLGDHQPAAILDTAADQAPDAPALGPATTPATSRATTTRAISRTHTLHIARQAIENNLASAGQHSGDDPADCVAAGLRSSLTTPPHG